MFKTVLVANRGEIACRIFRTLREQGVRSVAVYSDADAGAPHVVAADEAHFIGPASVTKSYLNVERILDAAFSSGAEAIHPGYGLLSEHAGFASACRKAGLVFIGPSSQAIDAMGNKLNARRIMESTGIPVIPGTLDPIRQPSVASLRAAALGYPVMVKASSGGGGIGMQIVRRPKDLDSAIAASASAAQRYFGDGAIYLEKYIEHARHIEIQIIGDTFGRVVALGERECSIQRRHQKIIEECPSPAVDNTLRSRLAAAAVRGAQAIGYTNAGTMEFVLDEAGEFYFLEMNTRLQVEHPVTEMTMGLDLVAAQLRVAAGDPISFDRHPGMRGHAIECRIYAEDPVRLLPSPGMITDVVWPQMEGVRVDSGICAGLTVTPYYDPLLAKIVAWGESRKASLLRMRKALDAITIIGVKTNIPLLKDILSHRNFAAGCFDTEFIATHDILPQKARRSLALSL